MVHTEVDLGGPARRPPRRTLATGGTIVAASKLVERLGGEIVGISFLIELTFLHGREKLRGYDLFSIVQYNSE